MLGRYWYRHFAKKHFPALQESRLLYFASNDDSTEETESSNDENNTAENDILHITNEVNADINATQNDILDTLLTRESTKDRVHELRKRVQNLIKEIQTGKDPELQKVLNDIKSWHEGIEVKLFLIERLLAKQKEWDDGHLEPKGYIDAINTFLKQTEEDCTVSLEEDMQNISSEEWIKKPKEEREEIQRKVRNSMQRQKQGNILKGANILANAIEDELDSKDIDLSALLAKDHPQESNGATLIESIRSKISNIKLISIMDMVNAGKKYMEATKNAWTKRSERVSAALATQLSSTLRFLPLGNEVYAELSVLRESKNEEEKKQQKELMEQNNTPFQEAIRTLRQHQGNANKFNGALEYLAEHGWLYDFDPQSKTAFGISIPIPNGWTKTAHQEYLMRTLSTDSGSGQDSQKSRMENLIGTADAIEPIVELLEQELDNYNYWGAHTALDIAMRKGKIGESGTWITTVFLSHLRKNPDARKYIPIDIHDQLGNIGIVHPAWTPTFLKVNRKKLEAWQKTNNPERFEYGGILAKTIDIVEKDIRETFGSDKEIQKKFGPKMTLDRLVAKVLSAQTVSKDGKSVSIFASKYNQYRHTIMTSDTSIDAGKADDDFYGNVSDAHLIGLGGIRVI
ncbi:MAG: hypothetical protein KC680_03945, partial [Candidatus Peregrinibacteria bacterium]|nr:hypothetical protein [Candidatus Peregrinibacteria bacterium]